MAVVDYHRHAEELEILEEMRKDVDERRQRYKREVGMPDE